MIILWIFVILTGTALTIYGSAKFNDEWNKGSDLRQTQLIPDFLLIDCEVEAEFDENLRNKILTECKPKIHIAGGSVEDLETIPLSTFFDENFYKESKVAKKNYKLDKDIYNQIKNFDIIATAKSKDSSVCINLRKNSNKIILSTYNDASKESYIEVRAYDKRTNRFKLLFNNIQLSVEFLKQSKFITDLDKGELDFIIITKPSIQIVEIKNIVLKTKNTKYFILSNIVKNDLDRYITKMNLILR